MHKLVIIFIFLFHSSLWAAEYYIGLQDNIDFASVQTLTGDVTIIKKLNNLELLLVSSPTEPKIDFAKFVFKKGKATQSRLNSKTKKNNLLIKKAETESNSHTSVQEVFPLPNKDTLVPWGIDFMQASNYWDKGHYGKGVKILLLDSGVYKDSPSLKGRIAGSKDFTKSKVQLGVPYPEYDSSGHATHIAGTILGNGANGVYGMAPQAELYAGKICVFLCDSLDSIFEAIEWGLEKDINIISLSLNSQQIERWQEIGSHVFKKLEQKNIVVVASAGNKRTDQNNFKAFPANMPTVLAVGGLDKAGNITSFTNLSEDLNVFAPGLDVVSASLGRGINSRPSGTIEKTGTSMAVPHIVGLAALLISESPSISSADVRSKIINHPTQP